MDLATAKAVITGGASGLGFATAQRIIDAGGQVVLLDINDEQGERSAATARRPGGVTSIPMCQRGIGQSCDQRGQ